jgi:mannose-1-phosphate guanylyltransferase
MQALVLVGGEGTRLRPLTLTRPKPALTLVDRPLIRFMVDWLARHGVDEVVMACGFRAEDLRSTLGDEVPGEARIHYVEEEEPLGTAGPVRLAADRGLLGERFMVLNGDLLTDLDLTALQATHTEHDAVATLALYPVDDPSAYGLVRRGADDEVIDFVEKPDPDQINTDEVSAGAYMLERAVLDLIPPGRAVSIEREVFPRLVGDGLFGQRLDGYWMDIGTPERYLQASWDILEGRVQSDVATREDGVLVEPDASVADGAAVGPRAVVGPRCEIAEGATVSESVLLDGCRVDPGAEVRGSILAPAVRVGEGAQVGRGSVIGEGARIAPRAVLGDDARVAPEELVTG